MSSSFLIPVALKLTYKIACHIVTDFASGLTAKESYITISTQFRVSYSL